MEAHHYLGYTQPVGEHLKYLYTAGGTPIACMAWSSSPRHLGARDRFIGWSAGLEDLSIVFKYEAQAKRQGLSPLDRLRLHQEKSAPIMAGLKQWMQEQLEQKQAEPNSGLGEAIRYMLKRWEPLTLFLRV